MKSTSTKTKGTKAVGAASRAAKPIASTLPMPARKQIETRAYELYVHAGHPSGRNLEFWLEAERPLRHGTKTR